VRLVVALGGNAILRRGERGSAAEQRAAIREASDGLAALAVGGHELVIVHGNGPQVGALMLQHAAATAVVPAMPLDVLVAQTQGGLGYLLQQEARAAFRRRDVDRAVATVVTQIEVDPADPAFRLPTKPVGPHLPPDRAGELRRSGVPVVEVPGGAWRRVVPSPRPIAIVEEQIIRALADAGVVPIVAGGGGVPVVRDGSGYRGVEGVIDKDLAAALVCVGPKVEAAIQAVRAGRRAVIASLENAAKALDGAGTEIVP
jgi:carbamate kinase